MDHHVNCIEFLLVGEEIGVACLVQVLLESHQVLVLYRLEQGAKSLLVPVFLLELQKYLLHEGSEVDLDPVCVLLHLLFIRRVLEQAVAHPGLNTRQVVDHGVAEEALGWTENRR